MYNPFSVKAFGNDLVFENFADEDFDRKSSSSLLVSSNRYPGGNLLGLFLTASLISQGKFPAPWGDSNIN
jgi:hypothetical protein